MAGHDLIVIGGSMGGFDALKRLVGGLGAGLPAAVLVVLHTSARAPGLLGHILGGIGPLPASLATDGEAIRPGRIYVAPPDAHLLVQEDVLRLSRGARENLSRPAIDPLFRSAAVAYRSRAIGVILSGLLDDGTAGLAAIKQCGGLAIVQDPRDAAYPDMPTSARDAVEVDYVVPIYKLGAVLSRLAREVAGSAPPIPADPQLEVQMSGHLTDHSQQMDELGERTTLSCPDCGGTLWRLHDESMERYRCFIGHGYTQHTLLEGQSEAAEQALVVALRTLMDRAKLLRKMAQHHTAPSSDALMADYTARADELTQHADELRRIIQHLMAMPARAAPEAAPGAAPDAAARADASLF